MRERRRKGRVRGKGEMEERRVEKERRNEERERRREGSVEQKGIRHLGDINKL